MVNHITFDNDPIIRKRQYSHMNKQALLEETYRSAFEDELEKFSYYDPSKGKPPATSGPGGITGGAIGAGAGYIVGRALTKSPIGRLAYSAGGVIGGSLLGLRAERNRAKNMNLYKNHMINRGGL